MSSHTKKTKILTRQPIVGDVIEHGSTGRRAVIKSIIDDRIAIAPAELSPISSTHKAPKPTTLSINTLLSSWRYLSPPK